MSDAWESAEPRIVEELDYPAALADRLEAFVAAWGVTRLRYPDLDLPDFDAATIAAEPAAVGCRAIAWGDLFFRALLNGRARVAVLAEFAKGTDLDLHGLDTRTPAHPAGLLRHAGESDDAFWLRIVEARAGASAAGPDEWFKSHARAADPRVRDVTLDYRGRGRLVVRVLSWEAGGVAGAALLEAVRARLTRDDVRPQGIGVVTVESAA